MMEKCNYLLLIIGTNPFPNLIASLTRIKPGGTIFMFFTDATSSIKESIKNIIGEKTNNSFKIIDIIIDRSDPIKIDKEANIVFKNYIEELDDKIIELNFTGGTKVMSSIIYHHFKNYALENKKNTFILSYMDGEKQLMNYEIIRNGTTSSKSEKLKEVESDFEPIKIEEIIKAHGKDIGKFNHEPYDSKLGELIFNSFVDCDEENYKKNVSFLEWLHDNLGIDKDKDKRAIKKMEELELSDNCILLDKEKNPFYPEYKSFKDFAIKDGETSLALLKSLSGTWFEDYILQIILNLKENLCILDAGNSIKSKDDFEIDVVFIKKYRFYAISVTSCDGKDEVVGKLYEVNERAKQLGGDEAGVCFISLYKNTEELERMFQNVWDEDAIKNTLIIGADRFKGIESRLENWIREDKI